MVSLPPDAENTIYMERWCHQGGRYMPQRMSDAEVDAWAAALDQRYRLRNTDD